MGHRELNRAFFEEVDWLIRQGSPGRAAVLLREAPLKELPRSEFRRFAELARRAGIPRLGLRLLNPVVRPEKGTIVEAADESERTEYGALLLYIGATSESLSILHSIDRTQAPESLLMLAFALFVEWRYAEAIPLLQAFVGKCAEPYQRLIARTNLAAALIYVKDLGAAETVLGECVREASEQGALRLLGNARELRAQLLIAQKDITAARAELRSILSEAGESESFDRFLARKWLAVCDLTESQGSPESQRQALGIREEAISRQHWETVRDIDARIAVQAHDSRRLVRVWYGTPYTDYRDHLMSDFGPGTPVPTTYVWRSGGRKKGNGRELDLFRGEVRDGHEHARLKQGLLLDLLRFFCSDFYRPFRPGSLFSLLFPGEFHNPRSSPHRVHELVLRLRSWLTAHAPGLEVVWERNAYRLRALDGFGVRISQGHSIQTRAASSLERLRASLGKNSEQAFSSEAAAGALGLSVRSARRLLASGAGEGLLAALGAHSNRRWRFTP